MSLQIACLVRGIVTLVALLLPVTKFRRSHKNFCIVLVFMILPHHYQVRSEERKLHLSTNNVSWSLIFQDFFFIEIKSTMLTQLVHHIKTLLFCKSTQIRHFTASTIFTQCSKPPSQGVLFDQGVNWETMVPCFNSAHPCTSPDNLLKQGTLWIQGTLLWPGWIV